MIDVEEGDKYKAKKGDAKSGFNHDHHVGNESEPSVDDDSKSSDLSGQTDSETSIPNNLEGEKVDGRDVDKHIEGDSYEDNSDIVPKNSSTSLSEVGSDITVNSTSTIDLADSVKEIVDQNQLIVDENPQKLKASQEIENDNGREKPPQAWDARQSIKSNGAVKTTEKYCLNDIEIKSTPDSSKGMNILPNRINSPFFLKQLDISDAIIKTDPTQHIESTAVVTSIGAPLKKESSSKQRGSSMTSSSDSGESFSRTSSAYDPSTTANIKVVVRVRPLSIAEKQRNDKVVIEHPGQGIIWVEIASSQTKPFTFNTILREGCSQQKAFLECGITELIDKAVEGFSCTVFAFGQTGSGKTYTITGATDQNDNEISEDNAIQGLVPRSFRYLFEVVSKNESHTYRIKASFLEVYNEKVKDLLNPSNAHDSLPVRWSSKKGFYVDNLFEVECESIEDLMDVLREGLIYRQVGANAMNDHSSRSHSILTVYIDSEECELDEEADGFPIIKHGKISFIDLAGSERVRETKTSGETLAESNNINKSLLTLGNCISALGDPKKRGNHIPYRESKLTKLLADSLGGDGLTLMIACISPSSYVVQDTMSTLRYANRAKNIKNKPIVRMDPKEQLLQRIKREVKLLKAENSYFRQQLGVPYSDSQIIITPNQIEGEVTPDASGTLSPAIGGNSSLSSLQSSRNNSSKDVTPRATTAMYALGAKNGLYDMLQEYMNENESLKAENMELHRTRALAQRQQEELSRENERLGKKLDELGRVMLSTPLSREHVRSWISSGTPAFGIFSRQATEERSNANGSAKENKDKEVVRFPPVRRGSYPNFINANDVSNELENEKQKVHQKKNKPLLGKKGNIEANGSMRDGIDSELTLHNKTSETHKSDDNENVDDDVLSNVNERTHSTISGNPDVSNGRGKDDARKKFAHGKAWKLKKKQLVEKPSTYAAKFAARNKLIAKHHQHPQPFQQEPPLQSQPPQEAINYNGVFQDMSLHNSNYMRYSIPFTYSYNSGYPMHYPYVGMSVMSTPQHMQHSSTSFNGYTAMMPHDQLALGQRSLNEETKNDTVKPQKKQENNSKQQRKKR